MQGLYSFQKQKMRGFVATLMLGLMPFLCATLVALWTHSALLLTDAEALSICRTGLLDGQRDASRSLNQLLGLNPLVTKLRAEMQAARMALVAAAAAASPPAIAQAKLWMQSVLTRQQSLRITQQLILRSAEHSLMRSGQTVAHKLNSLTQENFFLKKRYASSRPYWHALAVRPDSLADGPPIYDLEGDFIRKQVVHASWTLELSIIDERLKKWFKLKTKKQNSCAATLKDQAPYPAALVADKF